MNGKIIGIRNLDFKDRDGKQVDMTQYWVGYTNKGTEGLEAGKITWNPERENAKAPNFAVGEVVQVEFNQRGNLRFAEVEAE